MMVLDVSSAIYYARGYRNTGSVDQTTWWFGLTDYLFYTSQMLMDDFGFRSVPSIQDSQLFLPFVRVDIIELQIEYLSKYYPSTKRKIIKNNNDNLSLTEFNKFLDYNNDLGGWYTFERDVLWKAVITWCKDNHIKYR